MALKINNKNICTYENTKPGDIVICINPRSDLIKFSAYKVREVARGGGTFLYVDNINNPLNYIRREGFLIERFAHAPKVTCKYRNK
jgi:hypothetical protein